MSNEIKVGDRVYPLMDGKRWGVKFVDRRRTYQVKKIMGELASCEFKGQNEVMIKKLKVKNLVRAERAEETA